MVILDLTKISVGLHRVLLAITREFFTKVINYPGKRNQYRLAGSPMELVGFDV